MLQNYEQSFCLPSEIDFCSNGYMTADQIQSLLPPIVLSLGAILPFLVASPPFAVAANARVLLICVMTLVIWLGYWTAYAFGSWAFASLTLTVVLIIVALLLFIVIFSVAQRAPTPKKNADGTQIMDSEGKPVMNAAIDQPGWLPESGAPAAAGRPAAGHRRSAESISALAAAPTDRCSRYPPDPPVPR